MANENQMQQALLFIYTETSLHAGTGSTVNVVDLPIQRERATQYPIVQGSGVKGALRAQTNADDDTATMIFGPSPEEAQKMKAGEIHAGAISVGDARVVLFPVRSLAGVFAYVTCPAVLARLERDAVAANMDFPKIETQVEGNQALVTGSSGVLAGQALVLEEYSFTPQTGASVDVDALADWLAQYALPSGAEYDYWRSKLARSLVILPDDAFRDFVVNSTEITTRVRLDPAKKTVQRGALWTQESLPSDVLLMSSIVTRASRNGSKANPAQVRQTIMEQTPPRMQLGGDETTGQGFVGLRWLWVE